ncbi:TIR domain-containing protein [Flavobacterium micromati]|uniref:TIR domain-containing protein n=1 Tax=Flavobacterium micromati TaxID=229205 RepID=A0A1M5Q011_9FLAO|nr:toll/interleukin-1 receptor domain-containing protein [Flavobacterium micromati]SHH07597.1 TIR domain-containing protein [Flavobacterium micromati]
MSRCTAPIRGHNSASAAENCPVCRYKSRGYSSYSSNYDSYNSSRFSSSSGSNGSSSTSRGNYNVSKGRTIKPSWSRSTSPIYYTPAEVKTLTPVRENVEKRVVKEDLRDVFLCHAWDDRKGSAKDLHDLLELKGVSVWFSEKDVIIGSSLLREIDKGLARSKVGIVLVTPKFLERIKNEGIADKELSALLARDLLVPIVHETTFEELRDESPLLGSRSGLSTLEDSMENIASKLAELVSDKLIVI